MTPTDFQTAKKASGLYESGGNFYRRIPAKEAMANPLAERMKEVSDDGEAKIIWVVIVAVSTTPEQHASQESKQPASNNKISAAM